MFLRYAALLALACGPAPVALAQAAFDIEIAERGGGVNADLGDAVALAEDGSLYVAGTFEGTATFDGVSVTSAGDSDFFLVKYVRQGNDLVAQWARRGGTDVFNDFGGAVAVAPDGSVYTTGFFTGIASWDGGTNPDVVLTTFSDFDAFLAKYTPEGDLAWVRQAGGVDQDTGRDLAVDAAGNVYLAGGFAGTATFGDVTLVSAGSSDAFLAKYTPGGEVVWARRGGGDQGDLAYGVAVNAAGEAHLAGSFRGVALFGALPVQSAGETDVFVVKYDPDGEPLWVEGIGADGAEYTRGGGIGLDASGNVYVTGSFSNTILVGNDVLASTGFTDVFVARLSADGDEVWGRRGGGSGTNFSAALSVEDDLGSGLVFATGYVDGTGTFDDEPFTTQGRDGYVALFDLDGDFGGLKLLGGSGQDAGTGVATYQAASGDITVALTGSFRGTATFDGLPLESAGSSDVYTLLGGVPSTVANEPAALPDAFRLAGAYPNPFNPTTRVAFDLPEAAEVTLTVFDALGREVARLGPVTVAAGAGQALPLDGRGLASGLYLYRVTARMGDVTWTATGRLTLLK